MSGILPKGRIDGVLAHVDTPASAMLESSKKQLDFTT